MLQQLRRLFNFLEKERMNFIAVFFWILIISALRSYIEAYLFNYSYKELTYSNIFTYAHIISFFICAFLGILLIIKALTKEKLLKLANLFSIGFLIVLTPPLVDNYLFHEKTYTYIPKDKFIYAFTFQYHKIFPSVAGYGLMIEILLLLVFTSIYIYIKTASIKKTFLNILLINTFLSIISTPALNPLLYRWSRGDLCQPAFFLYFLIIGIILFHLIILFAGKKLFYSFLLSSGHLRSFHFILMGIIGIVVAGNIDIDLFKIQEYKYSGNFGVIGITLFSLFFLWQFAIWINHIYDVSIDRLSKYKRALPSTLMDKKVAKELAIIYGIISLFLTFALGKNQFLIAIICIFLGIIYSCPPLRLRNYVFSPFIIGLGSALSYLIGYFAPNYVTAKYYIERIYPSLSPEAILFFFIILIAISIGSMVKDIDDYEGDLKAGVKNIFTIYGLEKGLKITSTLLFLSFLTPLLLFNEIYDFIACIVTASLTVLLLNKIKRYWAIFPFYFLLLFYIVARWL